jgi:hypothetical protein
MYRFVKLFNSLALVLRQNVISYLWITVYVSTRFNVCTHGKSVCAPTLKRSAFVGIRPIMESEAIFLAARLPMVVHFFVILYTLCVMLIHFYMFYERTSNLTVAKVALTQFPIRPWSWPLHNYGNAVYCEECLVQPSTDAIPRSQIFLPWRWRRYVPPTRRLTQYLHSTTSQKTTFFIVTVVKTLILRSAF